MNIRKAIEILTTHTKDPCTISFDDLKEAEMLGIEALKRWKERHDQCPDDVNFLLPGETDD